jgi:hypothetical protein
MQYQVSPAKHNKSCKYPEFYQPHIHCVRLANQEHLMYNVFQSHAKQMKIPGSVATNRRNAEKHDRVEFIASSAPDALKKG